MNMFKPTKATNEAEYFAQMPEDRREILTFLHTFIQECAPALKPHFAFNMLGYGSFKYTNYKKQLLDWPVVSLANQKNYVSMYVCALENGKYLAEKYAKELGKVSVGKSCIRFKQISDLNLDTLKNIIRAAAKNPGLVQ